MLITNQTTSGRKMKHQITRKDINWLNQDIDLIKDINIRNWSRNYLFGHIEHYNGILAQFDEAYKINKFESILEIGAIPCQLTSYLKSKGFNIKIVDIEPERVAPICEKYSIEAFKVNIEKENLPFNNAVFDLILFNEVFEHLHINPLKALSEIKRILKPNGILLFSVPNINPLMRWNFLFGIDYNDKLTAEFAKNESIGHMGHFRLYSKNEIDSLLEEFGFKLSSYNFRGKLYDKKSKLLKLFRFLFKAKMRNQYHVIAIKE